MLDRFFGECGFFGGAWWIIVLLIVCASGDLFDGCGC